jgi:hypothetical protein
VFNTLGDTPACGGGVGQAGGTQLSWYLVDPCNRGVVASERGANTRTVDRPEYLFGHINQTGVKSCPKIG